MPEFELKHHSGEEWEPSIQDNWDPCQPRSDEKLWRYLSLGQYVTLLDQESIWFSRADQFDDSFEGSLPKVNIEQRNEIQDQNFIENKKQSRMLYKYFTYLNCWHMNEHESDAMWDMYTDNRGVAIISTPNKLSEALNTSFEISSGKVEYNDYKQDPIPADSVISPFFSKRQEFEHEYEYRLLFQYAPDSIDGETSLIEIVVDGENGKSISVDVDTLVEKVLIAPTAPSWLQETVESVTDKYGYNFEIESSRMDDNPNF